MFRPSLYEGLMKKTTGKHEAHFSRGHYLVGLFPVEVFYGAGKNSRVSVRQVGQCLIASVIQLLRSRLEAKIQLESPSNISEDVLKRVTINRIMYSV